MSGKGSWIYSRKETTRSPFDDEEIEVTASGDLVNIAVTDEQAVDSYNATFTCDIALPREKAAELHAFLGAFLEAEPTP